MLQNLSIFSGRSFGINLGVVLMLLTMLALETQIEQIVLRAGDKPNRETAGQEIEKVQKNAEDAIPKCTREKGRASLLVILSTGVAESHKLLTVLHKHLQVFVPFPDPVDSGNMMEYKR